MERREIEEATGVRAIRRVSEHTVVVENVSGHCRPATRLEIALWSLLTRDTPTA
jgi:hypothetical protein